MIYGTSHFYDKYGAYSYYRKLGYTRSDVDEKIQRNEISVGKPNYCPKTQNLYIDWSESRYFIEDKT